MSKKRINILIIKSFSIAFLAMGLLVISPLDLFYGKKLWAQDSDMPNEYIFQVLLLPDWRISEAIFAYEKDGKYYLPISELSNHFEFFADVEVEDRFAQGYASREENNFTFDGARNEIIVKGNRINISQDSVLISDYLATDDLYIQIEILNEIWPVEMNIELSNLTVFVEAEEELSFMRDKDRRERVDMLIDRKERLEKSQHMLPRRNNMYQLLGKPVIDYQATYEFDTKNDDLIGSNVFTGTHHLGKALADFSANFRLDDNKIQRPDNIRFKLSRQSAGEEYLFPGVRKAEGGDVTLRQRNLISNSKTGRGVIVSNDNQSRRNQFSFITIEGFGPPGWDIELYNNEAIIEIGSVPDNGQYIFEDVVLNFGNNEIKILLFGPQGQIKEELRSYTTGGNMLSPGKFKYSAGILDSDREFILLDNKPRTEPRGNVKTLDAAYGLNKWLTIFSNYTTMPEQDKRRDYFTIGTDFSSPIGLFEGEAYKEISGGKAFSLGYLTKILGIRTNLSTAFYNNFESESSGFNTTKKTFEARAQLNKNIKIKSFPLGLRLNALHTVRKNDIKTTDLNLNQSFSKRGVRVSHDTQTRLINGNHERTSGGFTTTIREGPWQLRGGLNYKLYPSKELNSGNTEIRYKREDSFQFGVSATHNFETSSYRASAQVGYDFNKILGTAETSYERNNGWRFVLRAATSLHPYTKNGAYAFNSSSRKQYAPIRAQVFLDKNADGILNEGEQAIEGARLRLGKGKSKGGTDKDGYIIANMSKDKITNVSLDTPSLEDPYYIPSSAGFSTIPLQGKMIDATFPVIETGSIEGTAFKKSNKRRVPGLVLNLIELETSKTIQTVETGFDGYYVFEFIPPGNYTIETGDTHTVQLIENITNVSSTDLYIYGHDIYIDDEKFQNNDQRSENTDTLSYIKPKGSEIIPEADFKKSEQTSKTEVKKARLKAINDKIRVVINILGFFEYEIVEDLENNKTNVLIRNATIKAKEDLEIEYKGNVFNCIIQQKNKDVQVTIMGKEQLRSKFAFIVNSDNSENQKLFWDLEKI